MTVSNQKETQSFLTHVDHWMTQLPELKMQELTHQPEKVAIICVDIIKGFCEIGPLASPRVKGIVDPIVNLFQQGWDSGVRNIILSQDDHDPDAVEFGSWPPHCIRGTEEAETEEKFRILPFFDQILVLKKNSISSGLTKGFQNWVLDHPEVDHYVVVGDCSDLCTYQLAMFLRVDANERQLQRRVILPENCVQTYDMPVKSAEELGVYAHPGDLLHAVFLYHMALNGVEVVKAIQ